MNRILIAPVLIVLVCPDLFAQSDFTRNVSKAIEEAKAKQARLTKEEQKLDSSLYQLLCLAESRDTSADAVANRERLLKFYEADKKGRIHVVLSLRMYSSPAIEDEIVTHGGVVERSGTGNGFIHCRILPISLRSLISIPSIVFVRRPLRGFTR